MRPDASRPVPFTAREHTRYRTIHGLSPYVGTVACACGRVLRVVIGLDEVQPMRWRAALHAVD